MIHPEQPRRFGISDILILIAGLAVGLALVHATSPDLTPGQGDCAMMGSLGG